MKKFFRYIFIITQMICICLLCSCSQTNDNDELISEKMDELSIAIDNFNNSKNFTMQSERIFKQDRYENDMIIESHLSSGSINYYESFDIQTVSIEDGNLKEYYRSELIDGSYITYITDEWGMNKQEITFADYSTLKLVCTYEIELEADDFTYDNEGSKFVGKTDSLSNKMRKLLKDHTNYIDVEITKFEIVVIDGYFKTFEIEYIETSKDIVSPSQTNILKSKNTVYSNFVFYH